MLRLLLILLAVAALVAVLAPMLGSRSSTARRLERLEQRNRELADENGRLTRAVGAAEQAMRALTHDPRLDQGLAVQIDIAIEDVKRVASGRPPLGS